MDLTLASPLTRPSVLDLIPWGMMTTVGRVTLASIGALVLVGVGAAYSQLPSVGAAGLLHPARRRAVVEPPPGCRETTFSGVGVALRGWRCRPVGDARRGTVIYLHGVADNRASGAGVIERFSRRGFDVVAYDSRAHGESEGEVCTYGFFEKQDLGRVIDSIDHGPVVLIGTSLGAAVALQRTADDRRVSAVVAAETFTDLRTIASQRAPFFFTSSMLTQAFQLAEARGEFEVDAVSPVKAAAHITAPVLLIHGEQDADTSPEHSRRVYAALRGLKRLIIVPGAAHNESLRVEVWNQVDHWIDIALDHRPG
jgi:uncharacterized protein